MKVKLKSWNTLIPANSKMRVNFCKTKIVEQKIRCARRTPIILYIDFKNVHHHLLHSWITTKAYSSPGAMTNSFRSNRRRMHLGDILIPRPSSS